MPIATLRSRLWCREWQCISNASYSP